MTDIECPYCGYDYDLNHDDGAFYSEDKQEQEQCPECDKWYIVGTSVSYYHEGSKADCLNGSPHQWSAWYTYYVAEQGDNTGKYYENRHCYDCDATQTEFHDKRAGKNNPDRFDTAPTKVGE